MSQAKSNKTRQRARGPTDRLFKTAVLLVAGLSLPSWALGQLQPPPLASRQPSYVTPASAPAAQPLLAPNWPVTTSMNVPAAPAAAKNAPTNKPLPPQIAAMPPVQEELKVIQRRSQLIVTRANVVRMAVADPSIVDVVQYSPREIAVIGLELGTTTLTIWFDDGSQPLIYLVETIRDPSEEERKRTDLGKLERKLAALFPNSKVHLIPLSGKIIVKGQARDSEEAARILSIVRGEVVQQWGGVDNLRAALGRNQNRPGLVDDFLSSYVVDMLEVPGDYQVMLHVRIAELNRSQLRRLGIDWEWLIDSGRHVVSGSLGGVTPTLTGIFENGEISVLLDWLASNGTAKILAEPTLTVLSGHSASFLAGGEFPVPTIVGVDGAQGTTTTFRGFGTSLIVTPTVLDGDLIRMEIIPEFSQINEDNGNNGIQGLDSRRVQTTVELREGQTIVIAGLLSHTSSTEVTRIPFLGELPLIGPALFNAKRADQDETELLVLVTPEIVRPMEPDEVPPLPGFYVTHPTDLELFSCGMTEGAPDMGVYQLAPYGSASGGALEVGYSRFNPYPTPPVYSPMPSRFGPGGYRGGPVGGATTPGWPTQPTYPATPQTSPQLPSAPRTGPPLAPVPETAPPGSSAFWPRRSSVMPAAGFRWWRPTAGTSNTGQVKQLGYWKTKPEKPSLLDRLRGLGRRPTGLWQ